MRVQQIDDVTAIRDAVEIPGFGALPINAFVLHGQQPVLIDTGRPVERKAFLDALGSALDPSDIKWIWLTHPDRDHMGALFDVLDLAPEARLITTFMAAGYMTVEFDVPMHRLYLLNPGQSLDIGDRTLHAFRPPLFDSPMTVGFYEDRNGTCFSSDCFGGLLPDEAAAYADDIGALPADAVRGGQLAWAIGDSPWVRNVDRAKFAATYEHFRTHDPKRVLSTHLPPAEDKLDALLGMLAEAPDQEEHAEPDQAAMEQMMATITLPEQAIGDPVTT